jgi:predicted P-loop ATPase
MQELQGVWIIELGELESMRRHDLATLKSFLTRTVDVYRASHARDSIARPRRCIFGATTNQRQFLSDPTGARRWWCVTVGRPLDAGAFGGVVDQLWAEAVHEYDRGEEWHLTGALAGAAEDEAEDRREDSPWEDAIVRWAPADGFSTGEVLAALGASKTDRQALYQIRDALHVLGYHQIRHRIGDEARGKRWFRKRI